MSRMPHPNADIPFLDELMAVGEGAPSLDRKVEVARTIRASAQDGGRQLDRLLFDQLTRMALGLGAAQTAQQELRDLLE